MAKHFLDEFVRELESEEVVDGGVCMINQPWYNAYGDCIEFKVCGDAYYAERVDDFITIFRHHEDNRPIGYQIKSVASLIEKFPIDGLEISTEVTGKEPATVSLNKLILTAFTLKPMNVDRLNHYRDVLNFNMPEPERDEVEVLVGA